MKNSLPLLAACAFAALTPVSATVYNGNGATGFGGVVGNGMLSVTSSGGNLNFTFTGGGGSALGGNILAVYLDTVASGFGSTAGFNDDGTGTAITPDNERVALSGFDSFNSGGGAYRTTATFPTGFTADYGLALEDGNANLFRLANSVPFTYVQSANLAQSGGVYNFSLPLTALGLPASGSFRFVASLISNTAYRANETIGASTTTPVTVGGNDPAPNAGFSGSQTFTAANTFTFVPEPGSVAGVALGALALVGLAIRRARRVVV